MTNIQRDSVADTVKALTVTESTGITWLDVSTDPRIVEQLGVSIAERALALGATAVVSWFDPDETVLAHIVARQLDVPRAAVELDLGLLTLSPHLSRSRRVLLLATSLNVARPVRSLRTLLEGEGHTVVGAIRLDGASGIVLSDPDS